jgi:hypothetical protein
VVLAAGPSPAATIRPPALTLSLALLAITRLLLLPRRLLLLLTWLLLLLLPCSSTWWFVLPCAPLLLLGLLPAAAAAPEHLLLLQRPTARPFQPWRLLLWRRLLLLLSLLVLHCCGCCAGGTPCLLVAPGVADYAPAVCHECIWAWERALMEPGVVEGLFCCDTFHWVILQHVLCGPHGSSSSGGRGNSRHFCGYDVWGVTNSLCHTTNIGYALATS